MQNVYCENASSLAHLRALITPSLFVLPQISAVLTTACSRFLVVTFMVIPQSEQETASY